MTLPDPLGATRARLSMEAGVCFCGRRGCGVAPLTRRNPGVLVVATMMAPD